MFSSLNKTGQAAIICSQGILFRGNEEQTIRENMVKEDVIEGIVALPSKLFYGTSIPGCILILNTNKPETRKSKIIFIYAARATNFTAQKTATSTVDTLPGHQGHQAVIALPQRTDGKIWVGTLSWTSILAA
jgi:type I restriction-modification system DNA methylase subunit